MQKYLFLIFVMFIIGCGKKQIKNSRFTEEQISSLQLESAKTLKVDTDSVIRVNLNPFLNVERFDFGSLVKEVKLIPLETTDESLLDDIYKVVVTDSNIYIQDSFMGGGIVIFTNKGKFIKRIPNGKGPGELLRLYDIDFDKYNNELVVYQHSFLLYFTPAGQFIRQNRLPFGIFNFTVIPEGYVFKTLDRQGNYHLGQLQDFTLLVTDKDFKIKSAGIPCTPSNVNYGVSNYLYNNNALHVTQRFSDTIYQYISTTDQLKAKYILDFNKKKLPERYVKGTTEEFEIATRQNDYYFYLGGYLDTKNHHVFFLPNLYSKYKLIVYRDKKSGNMRGGTFPTYDSKEIPYIGVPDYVFNDYFIFIYMPGTNDQFSPQSSIISDEDKIKVKELAENDNPVLVFYKLKNF